MLSKNIFKFRKEKGISQELLAEKVKVSRQTISNWELGVTAPNPEQLDMLANVFEISVDELIGRKSKKEIEEKKIEKSSKRDIALCILVLILVIIIIILLILFFKERDKNTYKLHKTTKPTTTQITSKSKNNDTFIRTLEVLEIEKVECNKEITGCDDTTFKVSLKQCKKETKELQISNSKEFKKLEKGKTYEFKFQPLVGEVYYEDNITNIFAFNSVTEVKETNKKCDNQTQDTIKTRSQ